jgi:hypothetical protein
LRARRPAAAGLPERLAEQHSLVCRIRPRFDKHVENIRGQSPSNPPAAREERVGLKSSEESRLLEIERVARRSTGIGGIALEHDRVVTCSRKRKRRREPRDAAAGAHVPMNHR